MSGEPSTGGEIVEDEEDDVDEGSEHPEDEEELVDEAVAQDAAPLGSVFTSQGSAGVCDHVVPPCPMNLLIEIGGM